LLLRLVAVARIGKFPGRDRRELLSFFSFEAGMLYGGDDEQEK